MCHLAQQDCSSPWPWCLSALLYSLSQVQLGDALTYLAAASLLETCSVLVSLPSVRGWCDCGVNVLCYSQAAHLCSPLSASPPTLPSLLPHTCGCLPFSHHVLMQGLLCFWSSWWRGCCSPAPVTVPAPVPSHSHAGAPRPALPWQQALLHCSVPCPGCPFLLPLPSNPLVTRTSPVKKNRG